MRYEPNHAGVARYLATSRDLGRLLAFRAGDGADAARAAAPVDTGDYAASIHAEDAGVVTVGGLSPRQSYRVVADSEHSVFVELADHPLQSAIDAIEG
ncbi:MAG: HK97 gp10 family phage protein [Pseudonocardiaceae bacterium]